MKKLSHHIISAAFIILMPLAVQAAPAKSNELKQGIGASAQRSLELNEQGVNAVRNKKFDEAEAYFQQALQLDPMNLTAAFNLSGMYITNKHEQMAVDLLSRYVESAPKDAGLRVRLGDAYFATKKVKEALVQYEAAYKLAPNYEGLVGKLGTAYALTDKTKEAEKMYQIAVKENPKNAQAFSNLSSLYLANGKPNDAITAAKSALQLKPSSEVYITLGNAYQQIKDLKNALNAFERANEMGSKDPELVAHIADLKTKIKS